MPLDKSALFGFLEEVDKELDRPVTLVAVGGTATLPMSQLGYLGGGVLLNPALTSMITYRRRAVAAIWNQD